MRPARPPASISLLVMWNSIATPLPFTVDGNHGEVFGISNDEEGIHHGYHAARHHTQTNANDPERRMPSISVVHIRHPYIERRAFYSFVMQHAVSRILRRGESHDNRWKPVSWRKTTNDSVKRRPRCVFSYRDALSKKTRINETAHVELAVSLGLRERLTSSQRIGTLDKQAKTGPYETHAATKAKVP